MSKPKIYVTWRDDDFRALRGVGVQQGNLVSFCPEFIDPDNPKKRSRDRTVNIVTDNDGSIKISVTRQSYIRGDKEVVEVFEYLPIRTSGQIFWEATDLMGNQYHLVPKGAEYPLDYALRQVGKVK